MKYGYFFFSNHASYLWYDPFGILFSALEKERTAHIERIKEIKDKFVFISFILNFNQRLDFRNTVMLRTGW